MGIQIYKSACPNYHVLAAIAWNDASTSEAEAAMMLGARVAELMKAGKIRDTCGICAQTGHRIFNDIMGSLNHAEARIRAAELEQRQQKALVDADAFRAKVSRRKVDTIQPIDDK